MADWWKKLWRKQKDETPDRDFPKPASPASGAKWLAADAPGNPYGVELLDLMVTQNVIATSEDPAIAFARWRRRRSSCSARWRRPSNG